MIAMNTMMAYAEKKVNYSWVLMKRRPDGLARDRVSELWPFNTSEVSTFMSRSHFPHCSI